MRLENVVQKVLACAILPTVIAGCALFAPWQAVTPQDPDLPWSGPNRRVIEERRTYSVAMAPTGHQTDYRWVTSSFSKRDPFSYPDQIDAYLNKLGMISRWPESQSGVNGIRLRVAPYKFTIVSVHPLIVVMRPHDFGRLENRSNNDIVGNPPQAMRSGYLLNYYEYGTTILYQSDLLWFSPDLNQKPQELGLRQNNSRTLEWDTEEIVLTERNGTVTSTRLNRER